MAALICCVIYSEAAIASRPVIIKYRPIKFVIIFGNFMIKIPKIKAKMPANKPLVPNVKPNNAIKFISSIRIKGLWLVIAGPVFYRNSFNSPNYCLEVLHG